MRGDFEAVKKNWIANFGFQVGGGEGMFGTFILSLSAPQGLSTSNF